MTTPPFGTPSSATVELSAAEFIGHERLAEARERDEFDSMGLLCEPGLTPMPVEPLLSDPQIALLAAALSGSSPGVPLRQAADGYLQWLRESGGVE